MMAFNFFSLCNVSWSYIRFLLQTMCRLGWDVAGRKYQVWKTEGGSPNIHVCPTEKIPPYKYEQTFVCSTQRTLQYYGIVGARKHCVSFVHRDSLLGFCSVSRLWRGHSLSSFVVIFPKFFQVLWTFRSNSGKMCYTRTLFLAELWWFRRTAEAAHKNKRTSALRCKCLLVAVLVFSGENLWGGGYSTVTGMLSAFRKNNSNTARLHSTKDTPRDTSRTKMDLLTSSTPQ